MPGVQVAVTLEQCWHAVPGGTAWSTLELVRALVARDDVDLVGVAARHRHPPPAQWTPSIAVRQLPLPRNVLYETWHAPVFRWPRVERATGPVDVVHATAVAFPAARAPVVVTIHDLAFLHDRQLATRHGHRFFRRGLELGPPSRPPGDVPVRGDDRRVRRRRDRARPVAPRAVGRRAVDGDRATDRRSRSSSALRDRPRPTCCSREPSSRARTCRACSTPSPVCRTTSIWCSPARRAGTSRSTRNSPRSVLACGRSASSGAPISTRCSRAHPCSATRACVRDSACRCSRRWRRARRS